MKPASPTASPRRRRSWTSSPSSATRWGRSDQAQQSALKADMTDTAEFQRWQQRYSTPDYTFGREPAEFLLRCRPLLPPTGKALAVADGEGRNGVWLARQGLDVVSIDFSPAAQAKARALAAEHAVTVNFVEADVHAWAYPDEAFDVIVEIFTQFST